MITSNTIKSNFNKTKATLAVRGHQCVFQTLKACRTTTNVAGFVLGKAVKIPFLLKNVFSKKEIIKDTPSLTPQEVTVEPLQGSNPLIEDISHCFKKIVIFYKIFPNKAGNLAEKAVNKAGYLLEKMNQKPSIDALPSLGRSNFRKPLDASLRKTQKFFPKEFLKLTGRKQNEKEITKKLGKLLACLQHFDIPHDELSKTFTPSGIGSMIGSMTEQLKLIDEKILTFTKSKTGLSDGEYTALYNAVMSIKDLQKLLKEYQKEIDRPIDGKDRIFAKNTIENNPLVTKVVSPTAIALGSVITPFITIDCLSYMVSKTMGLLTNVHIFQEGASLMPVLQNATITTASYALAAASCTNEEEQEGIPRYVINTLTNQLFMCAFAYIGARMCGSKTKVKDFVKQRISSVLVYKTCNYSLDYFGISFWPNKTVSLIISGCTSRLLNLFPEDPT